MSVTRAVIFDLDGCLVDSETMSLSSIADQMIEEGVDTTVAEVSHRFLGLSIQTIVNMISEAAGRELPGFAERFEDRLLVRFETELQLIPGALPLIEALRNRGVPTAIATGSSLHRLATTLRVTGLGKYFIGRGFSADLVRRGKPAPDLFLLAAERLGIPPEDCVVMEDSPHGVTGAIAAGMRAVGFVGGSHLEGMRDEHAARLRAAGAEDVLYDLGPMLDALLQLQHNEPARRRAEG